MTYPRTVNHTYNLKARANHTYNLKARASHTDNLKPAQTIQTT